MSILRDPLWQFIGAVIALIALAIAIVESYRKRNSKSRSLVDTKSSPENPIARRYERHKKRKPDGIMLANLSSDFLNQFPQQIGALAKHLDTIYTPENFGHSTWLDVFKRLIKEEYFTPTKKVPIRRITFETEVNSGSKLEPHFESARQVRKRIMGLED